MIFSAVTYLRSPTIICLRVLFALIFVSLLNNPALAANATFRFLKKVSSQELNVILSAERTRFLRDQTPGEGYSLPPISQATNDVEIYSVTYFSNIPERGGAGIFATGMVAIPVLPGTNKVPLIAYQHGTVYGKYEVPSYSFLSSNPTGYPHYDDAYETRYMVGLFAGNGYALMAADYFGMGGGSRFPEAYFVKASTQQANYDLYKDVQRFLKTKGISQSDLFLGGWSLGALNTLGFLEKLEAEGVTVRAAFTASNPADPFAALNGLMYHPRRGDAPWLNSIVALSAFSYENYYNERDLGREVINRDYYLAFKSIYDRSYGNPTWLYVFLRDNANVPLVKFLRPEYADPSYFANSRYGKLLAAAETYRQEFKAPTITFYGTDDEAIMKKIGQLPSVYQGVLIGDAASENRLDARQVLGGNHRLTFVSAAPIAKAWMDGLKSR